jgi:predicted nucleic acid-binding protein
VIVVDTGPIVAAAIADDAHHESCAKECTRLFDDRTKLLAPSFVTAGICHLLAKYGTARDEAASIRSLESGLMTFAEPIKYDLARMAVLVERYADFPLGGSDTAVVALAELLKITEVLTIDRRHFSAVSQRDPAQHPATLDDPAVRAQRPADIRRLHPIRLVGQPRPQAANPVNESTSSDGSSLKPSPWTPGPH